MRQRTQAARARTLGLAVALVLGATLGGCGHDGRYAIVGADEGLAYRLDTRDGDVWLVDGERMWKVKPVKPVAPQRRRRGDDRPGTDRDDGPDRRGDRDR